jgi:hypothetical protein
VILGSFAGNTGRMPPGDQHGESGRATHNLPIGCRSLRDKINCEPCLLRVESAFGHVAGSALDVTSIGVSPFVGEQPCS